MVKFEQIRPVMNALIDIYGFEHFYADITPDELNRIETYLSNVDIERLTIARNNLRDHELKFKARENHDASKEYRRMRRYADIYIKRRCKDENKQ